MLTALVNGIEVVNANHALAIEDRGLSYGDGLFETMLLRAGRVRFIEAHLARLQLGCARLGIACPAESLLHTDIERVTRDQSDGIVKLIVTRGAGGRGYRGSTTLSPTRIAILYPPLSDGPPTGIAVRWCATRLARNAQLAGIKHLNRLEQVLAQNEWSGDTISDGLMMDTEGELICATASNVFIVSDHILVTPDLRFSGICGVMRSQVLSQAKREGIEVEERALWPDDLLNAKEVFVTNAVRGIRPVVTLDEQRWPVGALTLRLIASL